MRPTGTGFQEVIVTFERLNFSHVTCRGSDGLRLKFGIPISWIEVVVVVVVVVLDPVLIGLL